MVVIKRTNGDIEGSRREENIVAALDTYDANITYLSCMCGVDLPENEEVTGYERTGIED